MEEEVLSWFKLVTLCFTSLVLVLKLGLVLWWQPRKIQLHFSKQGIRGPPYHFFIGNVRELVAMVLQASSQPITPFSHNILPRVLSFYHHWKKIYGATFLIWFGPKVRLIVSDPDLIREIFSSKSESYEKNEAPPLVRQLEGDGLLSLKGQKWSLHRKIIGPTFHMENLKMLIPVMETSTVGMLDKWWAMAEKEGEVEIEVVEWFQNLTEDVITRMALGRSYEDGKAIFKLQAQQMLLAADAFQKVLIPGYRFFPTNSNIDSWKLDKRIKRSLVRVIERRRGQEEEEEGEGVKDLLGLMIKAAKSAKNVTVEDIVGECKSFFFAGKHTTSNLLTWTTILLAMHPQWQIQARDQVLFLCGSRDLPSKDDISKLHKLNMIVNEPLRLYPPTIATIRRAKTDVDLGGYRIPRGTELLIPIMAVHHDRSIWGNDANEFNPGRFAEGLAHAANHPVAFIPFGLGVRTCIGQNLAVLQTKLALAIILQRFSFTLSPRYQHAPMVQMLLYPQHGAPIVFRPLS